MPRRILTAADAIRRNQSMDTSVTAPIRAALVGPQANLRRYSVPTERTDPTAYNPSVDTVIEWPDLATGEVADQDSAQVFLGDARLLYFTKIIGVDGSCMPSTTFPNRVRAANFIFKTGNGFDRSAAFYDRDVAIGDIVNVRAVVGGDLVSHTSSVTGFVGDPVAATVGASEADPNNHATQSLSVSTSQTAGTPFNDVTLTADASAYDSLDDGGISRVYTITVTQSSTGGDFTTALLRIRSSDGLDDLDDVSPAAAASPTDIGTKGLTGTFDINPAQSSASSFGIDEDDLIAGQQWTITVAQAFTQPTHASGGTYTGPEDDTYVIRVSRGGTLGSTPYPQITVSTARGTDSSGPTDVPTSGGAVAVGSYNVTVTFTGTQMRGNDVYYVEVTAEDEGELRTIVMSHNVPDDLEGVEVDLRLYIPQNGVELARTRTVPSDAVNWSADEDGVTVEAGIYLTDPTLTDGGDLVGVPLDSADVYVSYRAWAPPASPRVVRVATPAAAVEELGTSDPDNPIAWAATRALANTAGQLVTNPTVTAAANTDPVICVVTGDPSDQDNWVAAFEALEAEFDTYDIVPLTTDADAIAAAWAHVQAQSTDVVGYQRVLWVQGVVEETVAVVDPTTTDDELVATATIAAYPSVTPTEYTLVTASDNVDFLEADVREGDLFRINYSVDVFGVESYDEYEVETVLSATTLRLDTGPAGAVTVPLRFEVWRTPTRGEVVQQLIAQAAAYGDRRVRVVWPDQASFGGETFPGYFLNAAIAGLAGSVPTQQGLLYVGVEGVDDLPRATGFFTRGQLDDLKAGGVFVVDQDRDDFVYVRAAVTTDVSGVTDKEEMCVRNGDAVRFAIMDAWAPLLGVANVTDQVEQLLRAAIGDLEARLKSNNQVPVLGPPVAQITLDNLTSVPGAPDELAAAVTVVIPNPLNAIRMTISLASITG